jgi:hypothetical protein
MSPLNSGKVIFLIPDLRAWRSSGLGEVILYSTIRIDRLGSAILIQALHGIDLLGCIQIGVLFKGIWRLVDIKIHRYGLSFAPASRFPHNLHYGVSYNR